MTPGARLRELRGELSTREGRRVTQREVAERGNISLSSLQKWESDAQVPHGENLLAIARFYGVSPEHILSGAPGAPVLGPIGGEGVVAPNYTDLGIDLPGYERLHDRPRGMFDRFMVELFKLGAGREGMESLGRALLAPVLQMNTLHKGRHDADTGAEEDQVRIMDRMIPTLLEIAKEQVR
jgi:transcriptional regulator with XRE-family HTH domain